MFHPSGTFPYLMIALMRPAISWLQRSGEAFKISVMTFDGPGDFPNFILYINDSTILAVI